MAQARSIEGTWDELAEYAVEFRGKRLRLTVLNDEPSAPQNLAEFLGDYIGSIEGSGANNSEDTAERFASYLVAKHQDHRL